MSYEEEKDIPQPDDKEFAWVLYDVGNSAYTMLACALIPIWFKAMAIGRGRGS